MKEREHSGRATGPRTATGKAKSSRNALKHGLSARRHLGNEEAQAIDDEAGRIAAELPWPVETAVIVEWVTCRIELANVRQVRADALRRAPEKVPRIEWRARFSQLAERLAAQGGGSIQDQLKFKLIPDLDARTYSEIYADELAEALRTWHRIDRYESRIRSRMNTLHRLIYSIEGALHAIHGRTGR